METILATPANLKIICDEANPTPRLIQDPTVVHVGRVKVNSDDQCGLWICFVADNLQVGAALNALLIAKVAIANNVIGGS
ncbi:hypothetical protein FKV68_23605 (plasmid) [Sinorhizobium mexicanum]|uniref:Aspartate-semialdehyde dehydrogenase n=1 Tax=Sinorhizobium mexicanum TaxID=375549 RepID=A0A859QEV9_9HYPH|nr:hypothetical protein FKV68_23605 [Sinorhizobium mexicanum]